MENEDFFNIDFQSADKLGILDIPETNSDDETNKEDIETNDSKQEVNEELKEGATEGDENPDSNTKQEQGSPNISSSIALTLADNGVLQTLDSERLNKIKTTEDLIEAFREDLRNQQDEQQKRITDALNAGVEPNKIQQYEQILSTLEGINEETIESEGKQFENYRKNIIYQDYINKGFEEDDAKEMVERSINSGNDIEDAKKALASCKKFYKKEYDNLVLENKKEFEKNEREQKKRIEELKTSIIDDDEFYDSLDVSKTLRNKIFDVATKPIKQEDGSRITELQKYMKDNPNESLKMISTLYVITDGFKKFDGIFKGAVKKKVRESTKNLERLLTQSPMIDGSLNYKSGLGSIGETNKIIGFDI